MPQRPNLFWSVGSNSIRSTTSASDWWNASCEDSGSFPTSPVRLLGKWWRLGFLQTHHYIESCYPTPAAYLPPSRPSLSAVETCTMHLSCDCPYSPCSGCPRCLLPRPPLLLLHLIL